MKCHLEPGTTELGSDCVTDCCDDGEIQHDQEKHQSQGDQKYGKFNTGNILVVLAGYLLRLYISP